MSFFAPKPGAEDGMVTFEVSGLDECASHRAGAWVPTGEQITEVPAIVADPDPKAPPPDDKAIPVEETIAACEAAESAAAAES